VKDEGCGGFLAWALPQLGLRGAGFRRNQRQVCRRIARRIAELELPDLAAYRRRLGDDPTEWRALDRACRVTVTRFGRDRAVWAHLAGLVLPRLARAAAEAQRATVRAWCAGCAGGEEPYTLAIAWTVEVAAPGAVRLDVLATDVDETELARARAGCYPTGALRELPASWRDAAFEPGDGGLLLRAGLREGVRFARHDVRAAPPDGRFDLVLCRNLAFTYFAEPTQRAVAASLRAALRDGGVLVIGAAEHLPSSTPGFDEIGPRIFEATL